MGTYQPNLCSQCPALLSPGAGVSMQENARYLAALRKLLDRPANRVCADCKDGSAGSRPSWASISCGVFICMRCAGVHRGLGVHVSKASGCIAQGGAGAGGVRSPVGATPAGDERVLRVAGPGRAKCGCHVIVVVVVSRFCHGLLLCTVWACFCSWAARQGSPRLRNLYFVRLGCSSEGYGGGAM